MMQFEKYTEYAVEQAKKLLAIDSPSGYGYYVTEYLLKEFAALGIPARRTIKGGVIADFGGKEDENGILLEQPLIHRIHLPFHIIGKFE